MAAKDKNKFVLIIFGGTGDLAHRKIMPAIYSLYHENMLEENFVIVAIGRRDKSSEEYRGGVLESIRKFGRFDAEGTAFEKLKNKIFYFRAEFEKQEEYTRLRSFLDDLDKRYDTEGNRIYYLAVAPENYPIIINNLASASMVDNVGSWQRIVVEKPFGKDTKSAIKLNNTTTRVFDEKQTYRIDHYLGKEMVQSILGIRFVNTLFEPVWCKEYIDNIQISSTETIGVADRGGYYEEAGAIGDMLQNHLLQILALIAMEPPKDMQAESIRDEKVRLLKSIHQSYVLNGKINAVFGQYSGGVTEGESVPAYRSENRIPPDSNTETYVALKLEINNERWGNTPFYIRTGKRLAKKSTEIIVQFKSRYHIGIGNDNVEPNLLIIRIQPKEEIYVQFNTKQPGIEGKICPVKMHFCQNCEICEAGSCSPEAYEKLLFDVVNGDSTLFTRWDEVEHSWKIIDEITGYKSSKDLEFPNYEPGTWGPQEADELLDKEGRHWWNLVDS